nr:MAG: polyprotein [Picornavirales sp.]
MSCRTVERLNKQERNEVKTHNEKLVRGAVKNAREGAASIEVTKDAEGWGYNIVNKKRLEARETEDRNTVPSTAPVSAEFAMSATRARTARVKYAERQRRILPPGVKHRDEVSPLLDLVATPNMTAVERLEAYSKKHKCVHGRSYNKYRFDNKWFVPLCDHQYESIGHDVEVTCRRCKSASARIVHRVCGCKGIYCSRCHFTLYEHEGKLMPLACDCNQELKRASVEDEFKIPIMPNGQYEHWRLENNIATFLAKVTNTKPKARGSYKGVVAKESIVDYLKKELSPEKEEIPSLPLVSLEEFPETTSNVVTKHRPGRFRQGFRAAMRRAIKPELVEVEPEGARISGLASKAKNFVDNISAPVIEAVKSTIASLKNWLLSWKPKMLEEFASIAKFGVLILRVLTSILNALLKKSPMELALWVSCAAGSKAQMCLAFSTLLVDALNEFLDESVWCTGVLKLLTDSVDDSIQNWKTNPNRRKVIDMDETIRSMFKCFYELDDALLKTRPPHTVEDMRSWLVLQPTSKQREEMVIMFNKLAELDHEEVNQRMAIISVEVQQEGISEILQSCILLLPQEFHLGSLKTVSLFCKEILPVILVAKNVIEFSGKIYTWIVSILGFHTTDTRTWLNMEFQKEISPVKKAALSAFDYKLMANCDHPQAGQKLVEAKKFREELAEFIKSEERFDQYSIKFMSEIDKLISTTSLPPMARKHEPFCVRLFGLPGTGKSTSIPVLFGPILGVKTVEEFYQKSFSRNMSEYWDGVGNRQCILYDDFGQNRTEPVDLMELILLISAAPFMANFANITGSTPKGMSIDPKLVIASSNVDNDYTAALTDNGAVARRFHLKVHVIKDEGICKMRIAGGSLTDDNENILPKTEFLTVERMQEYIYFAYQQFVLSRKAGSDKLQESLMKSPPGEGLLEYDESGMSTPKTTVDQKVLTEYFSKMVRVQQLSTPAGLSNREKQRCEMMEKAGRALFEKRAAIFEPRPEIEEVKQELGLTSFAHLFDIWKGEASAHYLAFCYGAVFSSVFSLISGMPKTTTFLRTVGTLVLPAVTSLCVALYLWSTMREVTPESSVAKGKAAPRQVVAESGSTAVSDVQRVLEKATCRLTTQDGITVVNAILVGGTSLLTVEHAFIPPVREKISSDLYYQEGKIFHLYVPFVSNHIEFKFERKRLRPITKIIEGNKIEVDAVVYELPRDLIPMRKRILTRFWKGEILLKNKRALVLDHVDRTRTQIWKESTLNAEEQVFYVQNGKKWVQHLVHGTHASEPGSCGAPTMLATGETNAAILGIHVARHPSGTPMILVLTQEMIERAMPDARIFDPPAIEGKHTTEEVSQETALLDDTTLLHLGETKKRMFIPSTTTLRASPLQGVIQPPLTEPSVLHPSDPRIPLDLVGKVDLFRDGIDKMKKPITLSFEELESVRNDMIDWYLSKFAERGFTIGAPLSMKIVFNGDSVLNGVDLTTSCGYPFTFDGIDKSKVLVREPSQIVVGKSPFFEQLLKDLLAIVENRIPQWFVTGSLKDERRPIAKVRVKPKTRLFSVCPLVMICLEKMYFGHFMRCLLSTKGVPYVGGMDRLGRDWHDMFADLRVISDRGFGGDYQCYDGSLSEGLISSALTIMEASLDPKSLDDFFTIRPSESDGSLESLRLIQDINDLEIKHRDILRAVKQSLVNPVYLLKSQIFQAVGTLTSGCWTTQLVGTLSNELMLRAAWNDLVPRHVRGGYFYKKYVENKIMSDDNINSVERSLIPVYNGVTYSDWLRKRGMVYTSAKKDGDAAAVEPLETISFLKNTTGLLKGFYCPLMDQEAAIEISNWIRESKYVSEQEATEMNANSTLRAIFYYGEPNFLFIRNAFLRVMPSLKLVDYNTLLHQYLNYGCFPGTQFDAYNYSEEMNIMPREPELLSLPSQQEVECSSSEADTQGVDRLNSMSDADDLSSMIEVKQEVKISYQCEFCDIVLTSRNRLIDHMVANHQEKESPHSTILDFFQQASQSEFKEIYAELMKPNPNTKAVSLVNLAAKEGISKTTVVTTLNNMLSYVAGRLDYRKTLNTNAGALSMDTIFVSKAMPKKKINLDSLLASITQVVKTEIDEGYEVVEVKQESGSIEGDLGDITFGFFDENGGAETTGSTVETDAPIVTSPETDIQMKDPVDEKRTIDNQQGTILTDKGQIDKVKVRTTSFVAPRAQATLNDQSWNLEKMLQKWHPITDVKWSVSDAQGAILYTAEVLKDIIKSGFAGTAFTVFKDFRCAGVRIKAVIVGSKWHQGRALLGFSPSMVPLSTGAYTRPWTSSDALLMGAAKLDPSVGGTTEFYIPFRHPKTYLALEEDDSLGQLNVSVLSQLKVSSSASQEVTIKLFFCVDQPVFKIPRATPITFKMLSELGKRIGSQIPGARTMSEFKPIQVVQQSGSGGIAGSQPPINAYPIEGAYISAQRAKTGDPRTKQFGETDPNLINHCKRYRKVKENIRVTMSTSIEWETIDLYDILKTFWPLWMFNAMRGAINIKIFTAYTTGSSQPIKGMTEVYFEPQPNDQVSAEDPKYKAALSTAGSTIDAFRAVSRQEQGCIEVQIPFAHRSGIALNPFFYREGVQSTTPYLWKGRLYVRHCPATGAGPNYRSLWVYASLSDEFGMGIFRGVPPCRFNSNYPGFKASSRLQEVVQEGILDGLIDKGLETIKEQIVPEKIISNVLSCLDKPAIATVPEFVTHKDSGFMNFSSGPEPIDKLGMHPACQQIVDAEHFGTSENEANLISLFKRPNLLGSFIWKSGNESQDMLASFKVHPMVEFDNGILSGDFKPLLLTYLASKFKYWRGGLTFIFEVAGTNFQEGRLDFTFHPNTSVVPGDYETRMSQYTMSCSLKNTENRYAITVPYLAEEPFRRVWNGEEYNEPSATASPPACTEFHSGVLGVSVGARLGLPDNVPADVEVLVYILPASDFELNTISVDKRSLEEAPEI